MEQHQLQPGHHEHVACILTCLNWCSLDSADLIRVSSGDLLTQAWPPRWINPQTSSKVSWRLPGLRDGQQARFLEFLAPGSRKQPVEYLMQSSWVLHNCKALAGALLQQGLLCSTSVSGVLFNLRSTGRIR